MIDSSALLAIEQVGVWGELDTQYKMAALNMSMDQTQNILDQVLVKISMLILQLHCKLIYIQVCKDQETTDAVGGWVDQAQDFDAGDLGLILCVLLTQTMISFSLPPFLIILCLSQETEI